jgi:L,D-transpeptidase ErfK/SrfK
VRSLFTTSMRSIRSQTTGAGSAAGVGSGAGEGAGKGAGFAQAHRPISAPSQRTRLAGARAGLALLAGLLPTLVGGLIVPAPADEGADGLPPLVGSIESVLVEPEDTLLDIAHRNRLPFDSVVRLNPGVDEWIPDPGTIVRLPTQYVLPPGRRTGLLINVPEMRLYDFRERGSIEIYAVAVGDPEDPSPIGDFRVGAKRIDPTWNVPESILAEKPHLPPSVPPGPDNPLGDRWMTVGNTTYGIHGTNNPWSIGRMATHGCLRLYEDEMRRLYDRTPKGTPLQLVYEPYKWGTDGTHLLLEAHPDLYARFPDPLEAALAVPRARGLLEGLDLVRVARVVREARGVPEPVGLLPAASPPAVTSGRPS